jgi:hypothetical protein
MEAKKDASLPDQVGRFVQPKARASSTISGWRSITLRGFQPKRIPRSRVFLMPSICRTPDVILELGEPEGFCNCCATPPFALAPYLPFSTMVGCNGQVLIAARTSVAVARR